MSLCVYTCVNVLVNVCAHELLIWFHYRHKTTFIVSGSKDCTIKLWSLKSLLKHLNDVCSIVYRQHIVIIVLLLQAAQSIVRLPVKYTQVAHDKVQEATGIECLHEILSFLMLHYTNTSTGNIMNVMMDCVGYQFIGCFS